MTSRCIEEVKQVPNAESENKLSTKLNRLSEIARGDSRTKFVSLAHLLDEENLKQCYEELRKDAATGIDGVSHDRYREDLEVNLKELVERLKTNRYKATDIRRVRIPKPDGGERPLGILALEDKIVQRAVAKILEAIYEQDFLEASYGFRARRNCHDALKAVELAIMKGGVNYLLDVDIKGYFDTINHTWLMRMLRERIADRSILRVIGKWLRVGILEEGKRTYNELGVPQGGVISPILANIYLHYALDLWVKRVMGKEINGRIYLVRYCDDFIIGCTNEQAAEKVWRELGDRLKKFGLEISETKSRLIKFGLKAYLKSGRDRKKVKTFDFLGFTHYMGESRRGTAKLGRKTIGKRMRKTLIVLNDRLRKLRNMLPLHELHKHLCRVLRGYYNYYGFAGNSLTLSKFSYAVRRLWYKWLNRRSQRKSFNWNEFNELLKRRPLPKPSIVKGYSWIYSST